MKGKLRVLVAAALLVPPTSTAAAGPVPVHHATIGPLATLAMGRAAAATPLPGRLAPTRAAASPGAAREYGILMAGTVTAAQIAATGARPGIVTRAGATATGTLSQLLALGAIPGLDRIDLSATLQRALDVSVPDIRASEPGHAAAATPAHIWSGTSGAFAGDTGAGTVVGVVDTGIDIQNPDFQKPDGHTRVVNLWDQSASGSLSSPANFGYGRECLAANIDASNGFGGTGCGPFDYDGDCNTPVPASGPPANPLTLAEIDCQGHGTHVAGIAAGNGRASGLSGGVYGIGGATSGKYIGVAPTSDLVIVKGQPDEVSVLDGVSYVFQVATQRGEPASVNLSIGSGQGPHDGSSTFETMLDSLTGPGHVVSIASGNQGNVGQGGRHYHAAGTLAQGGQARNDLVAGAQPVAFDIWYPGGDRIGIAAAGPGVNLGITQPDTSASCGAGLTNHAASGANDEIDVISCVGDPGNGDNEILLVIGNTANSDGHLSNPSGWSFTLYGSSIGQGTWDAWAVSQADYYIQGGFGSERGTVSGLATGHDVLTAGSYESRNSWSSQAGTQTDAADPGGTGLERSSFFSGQGPTRDGRTGVDFLTPGEVIGSSLSAHASNEIRGGCFSASASVPSCTDPDGAHVFLQGTSMATPHAAGAVALMLARQPTLTAAQIRRIVAGTAYTGTAGTVPNPVYGTGDLRLGPGVATLAPNLGPISGGTVVDITGFDFQTGMTVTFDGSPITPALVGTDHIRITTPATGSPHAAAIALANPDGSAGQEAGVFSYQPLPGQLNPIVPVRILDTRIGGSPLGPGGQLDVQVAGANGIPGNATGAVINVTATDTRQAGGFLTVWPTGQPRPDASNLNFGPGQSVPNLVEIQLGSGGQASVWNFNGATDVIFDVTAYITAPISGGGGLFNPVTPFRASDTRAGSGYEHQGQSMGPGAVEHVDIAGALSARGYGPGGAVALNVTAVPTGQTQPGGFLTVYPDDQSSPPTASNLNFKPGPAVPNRVIVKLGTSGGIDIYNYNGVTDVLVDIGGWYSDGLQTTTGAGLTTVQPARILDTRIGLGEPGGRPAKIGSGAYLLLQVAGVGGVPAGARAVAMNLTVAQPTAAGGFLTVFPSDVGRPNASDLNFGPGQIVANLVIVKLSPGGAVWIYNYAGTTNVIADVQGWYG